MPIRSQGSRWINHKRRALQRFVDRYGAYINHLTLVEDKTIRSDDRAKLKRYLQKWRQARILVGAALYVDLLKSPSCLSVCLQAESLDIVSGIKSVLKFHRRNQHEAETIAQYVAELRRLTEHCEFNAYLEEALRDRLVCGLRNETIQRKLLTEAKLDLKKAYDLAHGMEMAFQQASELQASTRTDSQTNQIDKIERVVDPPRHGKPCFRCGRRGHVPDSCYYKGQGCRKCHKRGHIARMCQSQPTERVEFVEASDDQGESESTATTFTINTVNRETGQRSMQESLVDGHRLPVELDTGASVSIISQDTLRRILPDSRPRPSDIILKTYSGQRLEVLGEVDVAVEYDNQPKKVLPLVVVKGDGPTLLGWNWLVHLQLNWKGIKKIYTGVEALLQQYEELFRDELGTLQGITARLTVDEKATPKFFKPRPVPYAIKGAIERDLDQLEGLGVLEKIRHSEL